jgi:hypothetical protein
MAGGDDEMADVSPWSLVAGSDSFTVVRAAFFKVITWLGGPPEEPLTASCTSVGRWGIEDSSDVIEQVGFGERFLDEDDAEVEGAL